MVVLPSEFLIHKKDLGSFFEFTLNEIIIILGRDDLNKTFLKALLPA